MNIHEHQAKHLLKKFGAIVPNGEACFTVQEVLEKAKKLNLKKYVLKAQIHAGGRGKAGGVKILDNLSDLEKAAKELLGKKLITHQTGPSGKEVKRLYLEEPSNIKKEFYLSCLIDRASSKIAFISSDQGGMDIEEVAKSDPNKINTVKISFKENIEDNRTMLFYKWYGYKLDESINEFNNDYKYIKTIGVSLFRQKTSTSRHFGPLRMTYRILYNFNKVKKEEFMNKVFKVGLIGCGHIAETYFRGHQYFNNFKIVACADINQTAADRCAKLYNIKSKTVNELLKDKEIDAILNLTIPQSHYSVSKKVLNAGKHVYSEKPLATYFEKGKELVALAKKKETLYW